MNERKEKIWNRLPKLFGSDYISTDRAMDMYLHWGWTNYEIVRFLKCTEEVNPDMSESRALAKMKTIFESVVLRLQTENTPESKEFLRRMKTRSMP